jgi:hypothetical protein
MLSETATLILAFIALLATASCLWASWAAYQSVITVKAIVRRAEKLEQRGLLRELTVTAHRIIAESSQMELLLEDLKAEYRSLATFSGQSGGSRERLLVQRAELKHREIFPLHEQAQKFLQTRSQLLDEGEEELTQALTKFDGILVQVLRIKDSVEREIAAVAGDNRIHRGRRIKALTLPR